MATTPKKLIISCLVFGILAFATLNIFGPGHMSGMEANKDGNMEGCIFTGKTMLCKMSVIEHISLWQSIFTAIPQKSLMLIALFIFLLAIVFINKNIPVPPILSSSKTSAQKLYLAHHPDSPLFNPLKEAFSQGILNPKIYEYATL